MNVIKRLLQSKVAENYFFMTFLQIANLLIGLLLYPYLIRVLGKEAYGTYIFIFSNIQFLLIFVEFGFNYPALRKISLSPTDSKLKSQTLSEVFTAKICLLALCVAILALLIHHIPFVRAHSLLYIVVFTTLWVDVLFPSWYFQGIQKMKFVTYIHIAFRILAIPLIFIFIQSPADLLKYTFIVSLLPVTSGIFTFLYLQIKEKAQIRFVSIKNLKPLFAEALPFFWTSALGTIKQETVTLIVGTFFNMESVALYDLANKIVYIPRLITNKVNDALFPKVLQNYRIENVKKIIRYETIAGLSITALVAVLSYWAVLILGGKTMLEAYPLAVILSITIYFWLIVGCYINFIFVPQNRYYFVAKNQLIAFLSFLVLALPSLFFNNMLLLVTAFILSHLAELMYCKYLIGKYNLLKTK